MLVVAETGPLISLIQLQQLELLHKLYPDFVLPQEVFDELIGYAPMRDFTEQTNSLLKHVRKVTDEIVRHEDLDEGEDACIALYYQTKADALLIEDKDARNFAETKGIVCFGSIAVFLKAKEAGYIQAIKPFLLQMKFFKRFISQELFNKTLRDAGEI